MLGATSYQVDGECEIKSLWNYNIINMKKHILKVWMILAISFLAMDVAGQVYTPSFGATGVSPSPVLEISFNELDVLSFGVDKSFSLLKSEGGSYTSVISLTTGKPAAFPWESPIPTDPRLSIVGENLIINFSGEVLEAGTTYVLFGESGALLVNGNPFVDLAVWPPVWSFTTELAVIEPNPTVFTPSQGANSAPIDQAISLQFDIDIQAGTGSLEIWEVGGVAPWHAYDQSDFGTELSIVGNNTLSISLPQNLEEGTSYYVLIDQGFVESTESVAFDGFNTSSDWSFTTEYLPFGSPTLSPINGATGVLRNSILDVTFDKDIELSGAGSIGIWANGSREKLLDAISSEVSIVTNNTLRIDLSGSPLSGYAALYDVRISSGFVKRAGINIDFAGFAAGEWSFTTEAEPFELITKSPVDGALDVPLTQSLVATFNQNIQLAAEASISVYAYDGDVLFETLTAGAGLSVSGMELTIDPTAYFAEGTRYYVIIPSGAIETTTGTPFSGVTLKDDWDFTTVTLPPSVIAYDPDGLTAVAVDKVLNLTFDRPVKLSENTLQTIRIARNSDASTFYTYYINGVDTDVLLSVSGNVLTIIPPVNYESNTDYYVEISDGAILSLDDKSFPGISGSATWTFTTVVAAAPPVVDTGGYSPVTGSIEISRNPVLELTFNENIVKGSFGYLRIFTSEDDEEIFLIPRSQAIVADNKLSVPLTNITLQYGKQYYIGIDAGYVKSSTSGVYYGGISGSTEWYFTTETAPPFWADTYPSVTGQNAIKFDLNALADVTGRVYGVVTGTPSVPSVAQIVAGQNSSSEPARIHVNELVGSIVTPETVEFLFNSGTPLGANYYLHTVFESGGKYSSIETITIDRIVPELNQEESLPSVGDTNVEISENVVIVFNEPVFGFNESGTIPLDISYFSFQYDDNGTPTNVGFTLSVITTSEVTTVILQPDAILLENKEYTITIAPVSDANGNITNQIVRTFETDKENIWIGGGTDMGEWSQSANWSSGDYVPNKTMVIPYLGSGNYPLLREESEYTVFNLTIEPGALLTHQVGSLKVNGVFNLQSSSDFNASYIGGGFLDVTDGVVQIDQVIPNPSGSYLISSPVSGATQSNIGTTGPVMYYDNPTDTWSPLNSEEVMTGGYGYVTWSNSNIRFSGDINIGEFNVPLVRNNGQGYGWNYAGNPYTASIDWDLLDIDNLTLEDAFWIWDTSNNRYGVYNYESGIHINISSSIIPSNHGFLVKVKNDVFSASLPFSPSAIVPNTSSYIKSGRVKNEYEHVKIAGVNGAFRDEVAILFVETANEGVDKFDSEKLFSGKNELLQLFTLVGTMKSAINGLPFSNNKEISLGYSVGSPGNYSIEMVTNRLEGKQVFLIDKELNRMEDITHGGTYNFAVAQKGQNVNRFSLKFVDHVSTRDFGNSSQDDFQYYVDNKNVFVMVQEAWIGFSYRLLDINGRIINSQKLNGSGFVNLGEYSTGIYIIEITNKNQESIKIEKIAVY